MVDWEKSRLPQQPFPEGPRARITVWSHPYPRACWKDWVVKGLSHRHVNYVEVYLHTLAISILSLLVVLEDAAALIPQVANSTVKQRPTF